MSSATRLVELMNLFVARHPAWTPLEAAAALKTSRASAYRYFRLLTDAGYLEEVPGHRYALGPRIVELDRQIRLADPLVQLSADEMVNLARRTGGVALLCRLYKDRVLCIHEERGVRPPGLVSYERGRGMPLYRGATSKVILALLSEARLAELIERDHAAIARAGLPRTPRGLHEALSTVRAERLCIAAGEVDPGARGIAVPLCESSRVIGSLSVVLPVAEAGERAVRAAARLVIEAGRRIERDLEAAATGAAPRRRKGILRDSRRTGVARARRDKGTR